MKTTAEIRVVRVNEMPTKVKIETPQAAADFWKTTVATAPWFIPDREVCVVMMLDTRYQATGYSLVSLGTLNESIVHPRDVFRSAVALNAYAIVLLHNHPSGDPSPSEADHRITRRLAEGGTLLQIKVLDHVIIGQPAIFSFKESGVL